jgi:hypothetical protein
VTDQFVTVEFEMNNRREMRSFPRSQIRAAGLRAQDVVQLHCNLMMAPPTPPLSDAEVEEWERRHTDLEAAQAKTKHAKSLLEEEG